MQSVDVVITNDSTDDVTVTVYDTSTHPSSVLLASERHAQRIDRFRSGQRSRGF
jgi:hypothetical protein